MYQSKTHIIRAPQSKPAHSYSITESEFNYLIDKGIENIAVVGQSFRLVSTTDDWLDYGMPDLDIDVPIITLKTSRMTRA